MLVGCFLFFVNSGGKSSRSSNDYQYTVIRFDKMDEEERRGVPLVGLSWWSYESLLLFSVLTVNAVQSLVLGTHRIKHYLLG